MTKLYMYLWLGLVILLAASSCTADKPFWWMGKGAFGGGSNSVGTGANNGGGGYNQNNHQVNLVLVILEFIFCCTFVQVYFLKRKKEIIMKKYNS